MPSDLDKELIQADQGLFSKFKTTHVEKITKTAADVIEVLHENKLLVASILAVIPATSCSAELLLSHCGQYGQDN